MDKIIIKEYRYEINNVFIIFYPIMEINNSIVDKADSVELTVFYIKNSYRIDKKLWKLLVDCINNSTGKEIEALKTEIKTLKERIDKWLSISEN